MKFNQDRYSFWLDVMKTDEDYKIRENQLDIIRDPDESLECRAAACVADYINIIDEPLLIDCKFDLSMYENCVNNLRQSNYSQEYLLKVVSVNQYYPEYRIAAANELHRGEEQEQEESNNTDVPAFGNDYSKWTLVGRSELYNYCGEEELLSIAEGAHEDNITCEFFITKDHAREILLNEWSQPKPEPSKHPDTETALRNYPNRWA